MLDKDICDLTGALSIQFPDPDLGIFEIAYHVNHTENYFTIDDKSKQFYDDYRDNGHVSIFNVCFRYGSPVDELLDDETKQRLGFNWEGEKCTLFITSCDFRKPTDESVPRQFLGEICGVAKHINRIILRLTNEEVRNILFILQGGRRHDKKVMTFNFILERHCLAKTESDSQWAALITELECNHWWIIKTGD